MKFNEDDLLVSRLWRLVVVEQLVSVHSLECPIGFAWKLTWWLIL